MNRRAFSLVELMAVIALIALLTAIAAPYYGNYMNKSRVALAALVLKDMNSKVMALYNEGKVFPGVPELNVDGVTWQDDVRIPFDRPPVTEAQLLLPGNYLNDNAWMFCVFVEGLNFEGYGGPGGAKSRLCSKVVFNNGLFTTYCGQWDAASPYEIPLEYLPDECDVAQVNSY